MKITEYGIDLGIVFDNGNVLYDYHEQDCCEHNYADWEQLEKHALNYNFDEETFKIIPNDYGFRFGDKNRTFFIPCYSEQDGYYSDEVTISYVDKDDNVLLEINTKGEWKNCGQYSRKRGVAKMKLVDKLKKAYDYKKELYKAEKGSSSKEYHIENAEIFQDFIELELLQCEDIERRYFLMQIYRYGYQNIRSLNSKLAFKAKLDNDDINFIKILKEANILYALNEIYTTKEVKKIAKD